MAKVQSEVRLEVFNLLGQHIATLVDGERSAGFHTATWHATDAAGRAVGAGVYVYRMMVGVESQTGRMVLIDGQAGVSAGGMASVWPGASGGSGSDGGDAQVYGLVVSGSGLAPYVDSAFRVEAGMAPVELVVSAGLPSAGKFTDDDYAFCDFFGGINYAEETDSTSNQRGPDLIVESLSLVGSASVSPGGTLTLLATVRNQGDSLATATTLHYYRSTDATISTQDTGVGTDAVDALAVAGTSAKLIRLTTPSSEGTYYYGACVASVAGESNTNNNCSSSKVVRIWSESSPVTIPDANLRAAIAAVLGKASGETITKDEMETLRRLEAEDAGISDLTGLEFATNLTWLSLNDNNLTDVSALAGLTKLEVLNLSGTQITDISALAELTKLRWLGLSGKTITDIAALAGLTNLRVLYIGNNQITDVSALAGLTKLTHLYLWNNRITDVSALVGLTKLIELFLNDNPLSASSINDHIPILQARGVAVTFDPTPVTVTDDSTPVTIPDVNLRAAIETALGKASGETITKGEMTTLVRLRAKDASISDLTGLEFATNLGDLKLYDNNLTDISALAGLTKLEKLGLDGNGITDISALAGLTNLKELYLSGNQITDVSALARLTNLTELYLWNNQITDVSALAGLINLRNLHLRQNPLSASSINDHIPALQARGVAVTFDPTPSTVTDDPTPVTIIPDAKLRAAIAAALGKASDATITKDEMETLLRLDANEAGISDLTGLELATNLGDLSLGGNQITDLSALASLTNLEKLKLSDNQITDISALAELTKLKELYIGNNKITDISALAGLTKLKELRLSGNKITDVSALAELTNLTELRLNDNPLSASSINDHIPTLQNRGVTVEFDPTPVTIPDVNLRAAIAAALGKASDATITKDEISTLLRLDADDAGISDLTGLELATKLEELSLSGNQITNLSVLKGLTNLENLNLHGNQITDLSALARLTNLRILWLDGNQITDLSALARLTNLRILWLSGNQITDLSALAGLTKLTELHLNDNPLSASSINDHISALQTRGVTVEFDPIPVTVTDDPTPVTIPDAKLRAAIEAALDKASGATITKGEVETLLHLNAKDAGISDLTGLEFATNLKVLGLYGNRIRDVSALSGLTNLTELHLSFNQITDASALAGLTNLRILYLRNNQITDLSALAGLTKLRILDLTQNPLNASSINDHIPALQTRGVTVTFDPTPVTITDDPTPVTIPDASLRAAIETALGKARGETITRGEMSILLRLDADDAGISDLTGLEFATNLTWLSLSDNQITDISALAGLTKLTELHLRQNPLNASSIDDHIPALQTRGITVTFDPPPVTIPDVNLRAAIAAALGKARGETITKGEISTLLRLDAENAGISDLTGLEFATNLTWLGLSGNNLTDVSALARLTKLRVLRLDSNNLTDISALAGLTNLIWLNLSGNNLTDVSALAGLINLTWLGLSGNNLTDVSALAGLTKLTELHLRQNPLSASSIDDHIPALQARGITVAFDPTPETVTDDPTPETVTDDPTPETVTDDPTPVTIPDASLRAAIAAALSKASGAIITQGEMTRLKNLEASNAGIRDLTGLEFATNLTELKLDRNNISDISPLRELTNLTELYLGLNNITDVSALADLTNLTKLQIWDNNITDVSALADLTNLTKLQIWDNNITDVSALADLTNLTKLQIWDNNITDISALAGLTNLTKLHLSYNQITDVSALVGLTNLTELYLVKNNITDVSALAGLTNLTKLELWGNPLNDSSINEHIPALQGQGVTVEFDPGPVSDDPTPVTITDVSLRAAIEATLGKASGAIITQGEMTRLKNLEASDAGIRDLTGLEFATNLTYLDLDDNNISDISPLRDLTNLTWLGFHYNNVSDVSPLRDLTNLEVLDFNGNNASDISALSGLTNLTWLQIWYNNISDISALSGLTNLKTLYLHYNDISDVSPLRGLTNLKTLGLNDNNITDVSPLRGLTNLTWLALAYNNISDVSPLRGLTNLKTLGLNDNDISDVSPLRGLTNLTKLQLAGNLLNASSINDHIPVLQSSGATVSFDPFPEGDFDIELVFLDQFTESQKNVLRSVARRWMVVIIEDLPDYEFTQGWSGECGDQSFEIPAGERIDDLRIYVTSFEGDSAVGWGSPHLLREATHLPVLGCMGFDLERANLTITGLHEIGHVLGFGPVWRNLDLLRDPNGDPHFNGPRAIAAFNDAGGRDYTGKKVPVQEDGVHWRSSVFPGELMRPGGGRALSAITVQSLADLGYGVDVTQADSYTYTKISAKIVAAMPLPTGQGRIAEGLPLMSGDDHLGSRQESADHGFDFDLRDNRLMGRLAPHPQAEPKSLCGLHLRREPIYVVDPQGRIVRTISP